MAFLVGAIVHKTAAPGKPDARMGAIGRTAGASAKISGKLR
jgi:hypothetical protein